MQLTILLFLINKKGDAVPVSRTPLYTDYMGTLLDREVNRKQIAREQVRQVQEVTAFLGWHMHAGVETLPTSGRMTQHDIETTLLLYMRATDGASDQIETLFKAASDRFWALTSKVDGTFEFAVQPVREYFAAQFLAEWAGRDRREPLLKQDVLRRLIERPYWLNTARFYAGFASPNELASLRYGLEDAINGNRHPLQERSATWTLLNDGIFAHNPPVQRDVVRLVTDDLTIRLVADHQTSAANFPRLSRASGGNDMIATLKRDIENDPGSELAGARIKVLRDRAGLGQADFLPWWSTHLQNEIGRPTEPDWLSLGGLFGIPRLPDEDSQRLTLDTPRQCQSALRAGASPAPNTDADRKLIRAVLDGWCNDIPTSSTSEAGALLRAIRPQWFHQLSDSSRDGPCFPNEHHWLATADRSSRSAPWSQLVEINSKYARLRKAGNPRGQGQKGTTEPWQNPARELARVHGPCWLAAEIAISGATAPDTIPSGSQDRDSDPLGPATDYGRLVMTIHGGASLEWWRDSYIAYEDTLSRRTWVLALIATATPNVVIDQIRHIDECLTALTDPEFDATAASSSRIAATRTHRRLGADVLQSSTAQSPRTQLLISHFASNPDGLDSLAVLTDDALLTLSSNSAAAWPIIRAVTSRLIDAPTRPLQDALAKFGSYSRVELPQSTAILGTDLIREILRDPARYPGAWVTAAERAHSLSDDEPSLEAAALEKTWIPKVPRL